MTRIRREVTIGRGRDEVFAYLADFANTAEWDPGIVAARQTSDGPVGLGTAFDLVSEFKGRRIPLTYTITVYEPPQRVVLAGEGAAFRGEDDIRLRSEADHATTVEWNAEFEMKGIGRLLQPFLRSTFGKLADEALAGLRATLGP